MALPGQPTNPAPDPGSNNNPGATFDPAAFKADIMGEFHRTLNGFASTLKKDFGKLLEPKTTPDPANPSDPAADPNAPPAEPAQPPAKTVADVSLRLEQTNRALAATQKELADEKKAKQEETNKRLESERLAAIDKVLGELDFPPGKAKQQFRDAYQHKVVRDDEGNLVVNTDKGPLGVDLYLRAEFEDSPHFGAPRGSGGAGATGGKRPAGGPTMDISQMSPAEILKLPESQRAAMLSDQFALLQTRP